MMKRFPAVCLTTAVMIFGILLPLLSQSTAPFVQGPWPKPGRPGQNLPFIRFRPPEPPYSLTSDEKQQIQTKTDQLGALIRGLQAKHVDDGLLADVEIYHQAARWILEFPEEFFTKQSVGVTLSVLDRGMERARQLQDGKSPWTTAKGRVIRGYRSAIDGSVQPYRLTIPNSYDASQPVPLSVLLRGRAVSTYEVNFIADEVLNRWVNPPGLNPNPPPVDWIQLEIYGRGNNTYHWPGEADVFEAMASVESRYKIDTNRRVLRGFSMGGAGVWHIGLHQPDLWASIEVGAGDNVSQRFAVLQQLSPLQRAMCRIFDFLSDYSLNVFNTPVTSYVGELDGNFAKHNAFRSDLSREGFRFEGDVFGGFTGVELPEVKFFASPQTPHEMRAEYRKKIDALHREYVLRGRRTPEHIRFVTFTTRYNRSHWITLAGLEKHYERAEVDARRSDNRSQYDIVTKNLTRVVLRDADRAASVNIDGQKLRVKAAPEIALDKSNGTWKQGELHEKGLKKRHGLQGPIDDAYLEPFLLVRPTGTPWNAAVNQQALRILERFERQYKLAFRGYPRVKDDKDVTEADFAKYHVALFGDPGSNRWIGKMNGKLPIHWTKESVAFGGRSFPAADSVPALIYPNPQSPSRYVVINSGLTADWTDWAGDFSTPQLGDFAVRKVKEGSEEPEVVYAGLFDESWKIPAEPAPVASASASRK